MRVLIVLYAICTVASAALSALFYRESVNTDLQTGFYSGAAILMLFLTVALVCNMIALCRALARRR